MRRLAALVVLLCAACSGAGIGSQPIGEVGYLGTPAPQSVIALRTATPPAASLLPTAAAIQAAAAAQSAAGTAGAQSTASSFDAGDRAQAQTATAAAYSLWATPAAALMAVQTTAIWNGATAQAAAATATATAQTGIEQQAAAAASLERQRQIDRASFDARMAQARAGAWVLFLLGVGVVIVYTLWRSLPPLAASLVTEIGSWFAYWHERRRVWAQKERYDPDTDMLYPDGGAPVKVGSNAPQPPTDDGIARIDHIRAWERSIGRFLSFGTSLGTFSQDRMEQAGIVSRDGWDILTDWLHAAEVLEKRERSGTRWRHPERMAWWHDHRDDITLPYPDGEPPDVHTPAPAHSGAQGAQTAQTA